MLLNNLLRPSLDLTRLKLSSSGKAKAGRMNLFKCEECGKYSWEDHDKSCSKQPAVAAPPVPDTFKSGLDFTCDECGALSWEPHEPTCSNASTIPGRLSRTPKDSRAAIFKNLTCDECGQPLGKSHAPSCSKHPLQVFKSPLLDAYKSSPSPAPPPKCEECGNEIKSPDDHSLICSKHPDYQRTRPSRAGNVRFGPLSENLKESNPFENPLIGYVGSKCPDCGHWISPLSDKSAHGLLCPRRFQ
jgi:hypothetical protein